MDRSIWTDADLDQMGWHDVAVHAICLQQDDHHRAELLLDIDYVVRWIPPVPPGGYFMFEVSPATLVFEELDDFEGSLGIPDVAIGSLCIEEIHRDGAEDPTDDRGSRVH